MESTVDGEKLRNEAEAKLDEINGATQRYYANKSQSNQKKQTLCETISPPTRLPLQTSEVDSPASSFD